jgi:hypothetical protein
MRTQDNMLIRVPSTTLPEGLVLSTLDRIELFELEYAYERFPDARQNISETFNFSKTKNEGIHYFALEKNYALSFLIPNVFLSPEFARLLFEKLNSESESRLRISPLFYYNFLNNKAFYNNRSLFKEIFNRAFVEDRQDSLAILQSAARILPIDLLMLLILKVGEVKSIEMSSSYSAIAYSRKPEVLQWVKVYNPEFANLPLNWILKTYGFLQVNKK